MRRLSLVLALAACGSSSEEPAPSRGSAVTPKVVDKPKPDTTTMASPVHTDPAVVVRVRDPGPELGPNKVDGAALRAKHRTRLAADRAPVTVLAGGTALELGERLCHAVVPKRPASTPVLIKPNMSGFNWFKGKPTDNGVTGRTTDPEFVRGIVRCLKARGHTKITIADGFTGKPKDWDRLVRVSGYGAMAKAEGVPVVALDDDGVFDQGDGPGKPLAITGIEKSSVPTLLMPKLLAEHLDHGLVISAPKIKTHRYAVFSLSIKGMQGTVMYSDASPAYHQKWRTHKELVTKGSGHGPELDRAAYVRSLEKFAQRIADILELEAPDVVLAEGAPVMHGDGFDQLVPLPGSLAIGGTNAVLVDRVGAELLGLWNSTALAQELGGHKTSPLLEVAAKQLGIDLAKPVVIGDDASLLATPRAPYLIGMAGFTVGEPPTAR